MLAIHVKTLHSSGFLGVKRSSWQDIKTIDEANLDFFLLSDLVASCDATDLRWQLGYIGLCIEVRLEDLKLVAEVKVRFLQVECPVIFP